jgi:hypothetical protein
VNEEPQEPGQLSEDELRAALEEQMKRITVTDVLLQTVVTLVNLGGRKLGLAGGEDERDLEQARLAIEATRALVDLLPAEHAAAVREALSQLQVAYAREAGGGPPPPQEPPPPKIWTP